MLTLIGMLGGFLARLLPEGMKIYQDARDKQHEIKLLELQMQQAEKGLTTKLEAVYAESAATQSVALQQSYRSELRYSGWYAASVRPTVTYLFVIAFIGFKTAMLYGLLSSALPWNSAPLAEAVAAIWGEEESALFGAIISFWFGDRVLAKRK